MCPYLAPVLVIATGGLPTARPEAVGGTPSRATGVSLGASPLLATGSVRSPVNTEGEDGGGSTASCGTGLVSCGCIHVR